MKVYVQIVDSKTGTYQYGMIDEPIKKGFEVKNAIEHFCSSDIDWEPELMIDDFLIKVGKIRETSKIVTVIKVVSDQPSL